MAPDMSTTSPQARDTLDRRYDEIASGNVRLIPGEEIEAHFTGTSAARRSPHS